MAVARPPAAAGTTGLKVALFSFVGIAVLSLVGLIILYTQHSDLEARANQASQSAGSAREELSQAQQTLTHFATKLSGDPNGDPAAAERAVKDAISTLAQDKTLGLSPESSWLSALQTVANQLSAARAEVARLQSENKSLDERLAQASAELQAASQKFSEQVTALQARYAELEQASGRNRQEWNTQIENLTQQLSRTTEEAGAQLNRERRAREDLQKQLVQRDVRINELLEKLASFRAGPDELSALQSADGRVVRTVPGEDVVYINLGRRDNISVGMTFAVYSPVRGIPSDGKGKASVKVTEVFADTSEARITDRAPGDPVLNGDLIANPVYDKNRKYNFAVAGDFDLNYDNEPEDRAGQQVKSLIRSWGGNIVDGVTTTTDFLVLGEAPEVPAGNLDEIEEPAERERALQAQAARKQFDQLRNEARALGVPILNRTQFLNYIGAPSAKFVARQ